MLCRKCKQEIPDGSTFCLHCGAKQVLQQKRRGRSRGNGAGTAFQRGRSWYAQVTVSSRAEMRDGVPHIICQRATKGGFAKKSEALAYCATLLEEARNPSARRNRVPLTMRQIYEAWSPAHEIRIKALFIR